MYGMCHLKHLRVQLIQFGDICKYYVAGIVTQTDLQTCEIERILRLKHVLRGHSSDTSDPIQKVFPAFT